MIFNIDHSWLSWKKTSEARGNPCTQVYLPSVPTFGLSSPFSVLLLLPSDYILFLNPKLHPPSSIPAPSVWVCRPSTIIIILNKCCSWLPVLIVPPALGRFEIPCFWVPRNKSQKHPCLHPAPSIRPSNNCTKGTNTRQRISLAVLSHTAVWCVCMFNMLNCYFPCHPVICSMIFNIDHS